MKEKYFKKVKKIGLRLIPYIIGVILGLFVIQFDFLESITSDFSFYKVVLLILSIFGMFYLHIIMHEFGHFLGGLISKFDFYAFRIGPLVFEKENNKVIFKIQNNIAYSGCIMLPKNSENFERKLLVYYIGGIAINFILSLLFLIGYISLGSPSFSKTFFVIGAIIGFAFILINSVPFKSQGIKNDGANILSLIRKSPKDLAEIMVVYISMQVTTGVEPKDLDPVFLRRNKNLPKDEMLGIGLNVYRFYHYLQKNNTKIAKKYINQVEHNIDKYPEVFRAELMYNVFYAYAVIDHDYEKAEEIYNSFKNKLFKDKTIGRYRIEMAYELYINQDIDRTLELAEIGLSLKGQHPVKGEELLEISQIEKMKKRAKELKAS